MPADQPVSRTRRIFDAWEVRIVRFGMSPWSTAALIAYGVAWIIFEAVRGKWIGWDGVITLVLGEIALATLRKLKD